MKRVLVNQPRLMREMVIETITDQPDMEVVGEVTEENELNEIVEQTQPDVLILSLEEPERPLGKCGFLLGRYPSMQHPGAGSGTEPGRLLLGDGRYAQ